ncbi:2-dehydropantoate 2-reductase [Tsuneonella sp. CC-YZS046]|uniref:ketopantoate reductase family protein n=1 Tax=Tsuneonella sp. CC-YZS046 TaxID=3042152 RepID=UPI002D78163E|nr:2-dehydropantoate 2-reductase [Tsuneonella sp. CC-YZS046]WRO66435.1 2-dehydropantoate 2-reductase [Tsuneonella sp. CC-YZS046]
MPRSMTSTPAIAVIGAGALGSFLAARLAQAGLATALVARGPRRAELERDGIVMREGPAPRRIVVPLAKEGSGLAPPDIAILAVKAGDLESALAVLKPAARPGMILLTVQNGVEAPEIAERAIPEAHVLAGRVHGFFEMDGSSVRHVGVEPSIAFGPLQDAPPTAGELMAACLQQAAIAFTRPPDMRRALWEKFLLASAIGGVGLALGLPAGQLCNNARAREMLESAMAEIAMIADMKGVDLPGDCVRATLDFAASFPPDATSSLQRDVEEGRRSEFDSLTGAVLRFAEALQVPVPTHRDILRRIKARGLL